MVSIDLWAPWEHDRAEAAALGRRGGGVPRPRAGAAGLRRSRRALRLPRRIPASAARRLAGGPVVAGAARRPRTRAARRGDRCDRARARRSPRADQLRGHRRAGAGAVALRRRRSLGALDAADRLRRGDLVPALQRARCRLRPHQPPHSGHTSRRRLEDHRSEGVEHVGAVRHAGGSSWPAPALRSRGTEASRRSSSTWRRPGSPCARCRR